MFLKGLELTPNRQQAPAFCALLSRMNSPTIAKTEIDTHQAYLGTFIKNTLYFRHVLDQCVLLQNLLPYYLGASFTVRTSFSTSERNRWLEINSYVMKQSITLIPIFR